jgi:hypothetical protein
MSYTLGKEYSISLQAKKLAKLFKTSYGWMKNKANLGLDKEKWNMYDLMEIQRR